MRDLQDRFPKARLIGGDAAFEQLVAQVVGFVEAPALGLDLPLDVRGTAFQQRVWQALREIPAASTASYAEIAGASARRRRCAPWRRPAPSNAHRRRHSLPSRRAQGRRAFGLSLGRRAQARAARPRERGLTGRRRGDRHSQRIPRLVERTKVCPAGRLLPDPLVGPASGCAKVVARDVGSCSACLFDLAARTGVRRRCAISMLTAADKSGRSNSSISER